MTSLQFLPRFRLGRSADLFADQKRRSAHLVGICGSGMQALAEMLLGLGWQVTGSDLQPPVVQLMRKRGLRVHQGHSGRFLPQDVDVLVYSPAVDADNPERLLAARRRVVQLSYSQMLGELMRNRIGVSIAGTHGKSTTTAMTATILDDAGLSPSAIVGAELCRRGMSGWAGHGRHLVVESCEYRRSFLDLSPKFAAILGIEHDHFDYYHDLEDTQAAFAEFASQVAADGILLVRGDCPATWTAARSALAEVITFAETPDADWWVDGLRRTRSGSRFRIFHRGTYFTEISLAIPGRHNVLNALAAAALSHHVGVSARDVRESLRDFCGIRRRFESVGSWRGVSLMDDYAHHPTAVQATLQTARQQFGRRRIWCAFQPHQVSRTRSLLKQFAKSLSAADEVLVVPIFAAREVDENQHEALSRALTAVIVEYGGHARFVASLDQLITTVEDEMRPGDVLITMGAGNINRVQHEFTRRLQRHHHA